MAGTIFQESSSSDDDHTGGMYARGKGYVGDTYTFANPASAAPVEAAHPPQQRSDSTLTNWDDPDPPPAAPRSRARRNSISNWDEEIPPEESPTQVSAKRLTQRAIERKNARRGATLRQIMGLLQCDVSDSLVTLGVLLFALINESNRLEKGNDSAFGETLKFRVRFSWMQRVIPLREGWLSKQGEMGEKFKARYFTLLPDVWMFYQSEQKDCSSRLLVWYKQKPTCLEEQVNPVGAIALAAERLDGRPGFDSVLVQGQQMEDSDAIRASDNGRVSVLGRSSSRKAQAKALASQRLELDVLGDDDGFIDAGEMRRNYVLAPAEAAAARGSGQDSSRQSAGASAVPAGQRRPEDGAGGDLAAWAEVLDVDARFDVAAHVPDNMLQLRESTMDAEEEKMAGLGWRSKQRAGFHAGKCSQLNCSSVSKFLFFALMVPSLTRSSFAHFLDVFVSESIVVRIYLSCGSLWI